MFSPSSKPSRGKIIPALGDAGGRAMMAAKNMHSLAEATVEAGAAQQKMKIMYLLLMTILVKKDGFYSTVTQSISYPTTKTTVRRMS